MSDLRALAVARLGGKPPFGWGVRTVFERVWVGRLITLHGAVRSVTRYDQLRDFERIKKRLLEFRDAGRTAKEIAAQLNARQETNTDENFTMRNSPFGVERSTLIQLLVGLQPVAVCV